MPFRSTFDCLWCGAAHACRGDDDLEGWALLCPSCVGRAGDNRFLRVTWHPEGAQFVISHWQGDVCLAATRVADDTPELLAFLANGLASSNTPDPARWAQTG